MSHPKFGKSFNGERRMFNTKLYKRMKKLNVSQLERMTGGNCTKEGIDFASAINDLSKAETDWDYAIASFKVADSGNTWMKCMGWL